ncbi:MULTISPECIES: high-potential iron-sulfur protein [Marichromatium]|uniref:High-potential iron-sulfur protein n=1 Tax=Marichromatium gracile TaxID=1048 RepID=A0A4R4A9K3_MARGR|nr:MULTISPECIES: high-potential iron-sulfur protein [Marichromatium]MBO8085470.1 high-potential iron-sulfur protein [Marichromatium sp.]KXX65320.1 iron permease [Marichromatium gracile]MBK1708814.1 iron permease [Marichromatium gracile]RNE88971.1 iron permease [Marichromatium sp. AB31]RNE93044.1 iron permease [Marichromatium sp. AB32]
MSDKPICKSRRDAVKVMLGTAAAVPVINLVGFGTARAEVPANAVTESDPTAVALKYHRDAAQSERVAAARPGLPPEEQHCENCQFMLPDQGADEWRGCSLFPGKLINLNGWCASWTLRAG